MLLGAVLLWALNVTVSKYMLEHGWQPLAYGTIRYFAAISLFWAFTYYRERSFRIARADVKLVLLAAAMIFVNQLCFVYGLKLGQASTLSLLFGTTPIFVGVTRTRAPAQPASAVVLGRCCPDLCRRGPRRSECRAASRPTAGRSSSASLPR